MFRGTPCIFWYFLRFRKSYFIYLLECFLEILDGGAGSYYYYYFYCNYYTKIQGVPRNMTFNKSLFLVKTSFCFIILYFEINFNITYSHIILLLIFGIKQLNKLWKKNILNYSPTVMFRGTPCIIYTKVYTGLPTKYETVKTTHKTLKILLFQD